MKRITRLIHRHTPGSQNTSQRLFAEPLESRYLLDSTTVINELMYQPRQADASEWIELHNQMAVEMDLSGWKFSSGVEFTFPEATIIPGGGYLVIAADPAEVQQAYALTSVLGPWTGSLANGGERLELRNNNDRVMSVVDYADTGDWPVGADGSGASLAKSLSATAGSDTPSSWHASRKVGGTPGAANVDLTAAGTSIRINEIAAAGSDEFWVELATTNTTPVSLQGLRLTSSSSADFTRILNDDLVSAEKPFLATRVTPTAVQPGDRLFLYSDDGSTLLDAVRAGSFSQSRWPDATGDWYNTLVGSPGERNPLAIPDAIVINEIQYHQMPTLSQPSAPEGTEAIPFTESSEEWIELYNRSQETVDLSNWRLDGGIEFTFPADTHLAPNDYLVVTRDAASLRQKYPELSNVLGNFRGTLDNSGDTIELRDSLGNVADHVHYYHDGRWDWRADGSGPSLELTDPLADNQRGEVWAASNEAAKSTWRTYTYRGIPERSVPGEPTVWNELALGFLDGAGEALLDDIRVIEDPDGTAIPLVQNGTFDSGDAAHWRLLGNHQRSQVVKEGDNWVLHAISDGATEYQGNQIETTFANNVKLKTGVTYEISFRARWLSGSRQINSRLYFNRLPKTSVLEVPERTGTPGRANSTLRSTSGPTFDQLGHAPLVPRPGDPITVKVQADDPQGVDRVTLWYNAGETNWQSIDMSLARQNEYQGIIPGQVEGTIQFYVEATDRSGARSWFPATGPDSRALIGVDDATANPSAAHDFRLVMTTSDNQLLHRPTNSLSNLRIGSTVIYQDTAFYDTGVRLKGSFVGRNARRVGFNIEFPEEQKFRGVHSKVSIDRSTHAELGVDEILLKHAANHAGGIPSMYDDLIDFVAPTATYTGKASLRMSGFDDIYLDSQFDNGSDGTVYEYEVIRWPTTTVDGKPESLKRAGGLDDPNGYANIDFRDLGDNKESYRWTNLIVSNRTRDDYDSIIAFHRAMSATGEAFEPAISAVVDVDQWMRTSAYQVLFGPADANYTGANIHNFRLYARPDGKMLYMPWDWDSAFQLATNAGLIGTGRHARLVRIPANLRNYYGHMLDLIETTFNADYMSRWTQHYGELGGQNFANRLNYIQRRSEFAAARIQRDVPPIDFTLTTTGPLRVESSTATVEGKGWVNVRSIRLAGQSDPLPIRWMSSGATVADQWQVDLPVAPGQHDYTLEAIDYQGRVIGRQSLSIESTLAERPLATFLRLTEVHYNPEGSDDTEFLEWSHIGVADRDPPLELGGVRVQIGDGTPFVFPANTRLSPGQSLVVVNDSVAFRSIYPQAAATIAGSYVGNLSNGGETIEVRDSSSALLLNWTYSDSDPWPRSADGQGSSLQLIAPAERTRDELALPRFWQALPPTPGSLAQATRGDFDGNRQVDTNDIDLFFAALRTGNNESRFDLNGDRAVNANDRDVLIHDLLNSTYGDANLDRRFNSQDLVLIFQAAEYEDTVAENSSWSEGDWDGDGEFTSRDLVLAFQFGGFE